MKSRNARRGTPAFWAQYRDLCQVLSNDTQHDIMGNLAEPRQFALTHVGHTIRGNRADHILDRVKCSLRAGNNRTQLPGLDAFAVARNR